MSNLSPSACMGFLFPHQRHPQSDSRRLLREAFRFASLRRQWNEEKQTSFL